MVRYYVLTLAFLMISETGCSSRDCHVPGGACVLQCEHMYLNNMNQCYSIYRDCLFHCVGFDDDTCIATCWIDEEGCWVNTTSGRSDCMSECSCYTDLQDCEEDCGDPPEPSCLDICNDGYDECTGIAINETCISNCGSVALSCDESCDDNWRDEEWIAWVYCTHDCKIEENDCLIACYYN
jgi:hypothetical protein